MKMLLLATSFLISTTVFAASAGKLDGKTFCRQVETGGMFGQPKGVRSHCVAFNNGMMKDNANTFFGNPPEVLPYQLKGTAVVVFNKKRVWAEVYQLVGDTLVNEVGAVLTKQ